MRHTTVSFSTSRTRENSTIPFKVGSLSSYYLGRVSLVHSSICMEMYKYRVYLYADVVALTGCARSSLGICASSSGAVAGCLLWKVCVLT